MDPVLALVVLAYVIVAVVLLYPHAKVPGRKARRDSRRERLGLRFTQPSAGLAANFPERPEAIRCAALHDMTSVQARAAERRGEISTYSYGRRGVASS